MDPPSTNQVDFYTINSGKGDPQEPKKEAGVLQISDGGNKPRDPMMAYRVTDKIRGAMNTMRQKFVELRDHVEATVPPSAERTLATRELELSLMRANQALSMHSEGSDPVWVREY